VATPAALTLTGGVPPGVGTFTAQCSGGIDVAGNVALRGCEVLLEKGWSELPQFGALFVTVAHRLLRAGNTLTMRIGSSKTVSGLTCRIRSSVGEDERPLLALISTKMVGQQHHSGVGVRHGRGGTFESVHGVVWRALVREHLTV
jgi:hypothetical protein